jgi:hypothetical protein
MGMIDLTGRTFGRWSVVKMSHKDKKSALFWACTCECGTQRAVAAGDLKRGRSLSCGCLTIEKSIARSTKHNMHRHPAYRSWLHMKNRCSNERNDGYYLYGGRGIKVCDKWDSSFEGFWEDMGPTWQKGHSIERKEVNGNYEATNCIWASSKVQANNRRSNRIINTPNGPMNVQLASETFGISRITIFSRIRYGWSEEDLTKPVGHQRR